MIKIPTFFRAKDESLRPLKAIALEGTSKERMRVALSAYADLHTAPAPAAKSIPASGHTPLFSRTRGLYAGALALTLIIAGGAQASIVAEGSVPGDLLYPLKVSVAEPMALTFSLSPERKAELSAKFASRRVEEAATLASVDKLDARRAGELAARFDTHVDDVAKETIALESKGELSVSLAVRSDLSQKVNERTEEISHDASRVLMAKTEVEASEAEFSARISEKSKMLATTRERVDSAGFRMSNESAFSAKASSVSASGSERFFAALGLERATTSTSTATSTASSTLPRIFAPFLPSSSNR